MITTRDIAAQLKRELGSADLQAAFAALQRRRAELKPRIAELNDRNSPDRRAAVSDGDIARSRQLDAELEQLEDELSVISEFERLVHARLDGAFKREAPDNFARARKRLPKLIDRLAKARADYIAVEAEITDAVTAIEGARNVLGAEAFAALGDAGALRKYSLDPDLVEKLVDVLLAPFTHSSHEQLARARSTLRRKLAFVDLTHTGSRGGGITVYPEVTHDSDGLPIAARHESPFERRR